MSASSRAGFIATQINTLRTSGAFSQTFSLVFIEFKPDIRTAAAHFSKSWQKDFEQVGAIALAAALRKFPQQSDPLKFVAYAHRAIRQKMLDLHRHLIGRGLTKQSAPSIDQPAQQVAVSIWAQPEMISDHKEARQDPAKLATDGGAAAAKVESQIDMKILFSTPNLRRTGFSEREIFIIDAYFLRGDNVSEVAPQCSISIGQASKIISKLKPRIKQLLQEYIY